MYLIDGRAEVEIEQYVKDCHTFDEYSEKVHFFDGLGKTLTSDLPKEVNLVSHEKTGAGICSCVCAIRFLKV
jgi:hypothetical protein